MYLSLLAFSYFLFPGPEVYLDDEPSVDYITNTRVQISPWSDGTFLFNDDNRLLHLSLEDGRTVQEINLLEITSPVDLSQFWISSMGFLPKKEKGETRYVMSLMAAGESGTMKRRVAIFGADGGFLGFALDPKLQGSFENYYHQFITLPKSNNLIVNTWSENSRYGNERRSLRAVEIAEDHQGNYQFFFSGAAFARTVELKKSLGSNFGDYWLVERKEALYAMEEVEHKILIFGPEENNQLKLQNHYLIGSEDRIEPIPFPRNAKNRSEKQRWFHSFDRTTGFYEIGENSFLISWESPNPEYTYDGTKLDVLEGDISPFILNFIVVSKTGVPHTNRVSLPGIKWCIGLHKGQVFTLNQTGFTPNRVYSVGQYELKELFDQMDH